MIDYKIEFHGDGAISLFRDGIGRRVLLRDLWAASELMRELTDMVATPGPKTFTDVVSVMADVNAMTIEQ